MSVVALAAVCAGLAAAVGVAPRQRLPATPTAATEPGAGWLLRFRPVWSALGGAGAVVVIGGAAGLVAGVLLTAAVWVLAGRSEPAEVRRRREQVRRDLPYVVALLASALRSGCTPQDAVDLVCRALPGAAADRLGSVAARLSLGADAGAVWAGLGRDPELAPLGRALGRAHDTGAPVAVAVERLADELARRARAEVEDRARAVGVRAAVPLGICLLPAFVLLGILPVVAGLVGELGL